MPPSNTFSKRVAMRVIWLLMIVGLLGVHTLYGQDQRSTLSGFVTDAEKRARQRARDAS